MENNKPNVDTLLQKALGRQAYSETPSAELLQKLRGEQYPMKNKRMLKPSMLVAAVMIAVLSMSVIVYAAAPVVWRYLEVRFIEGEEFDFTIKESECGSKTVMSIDAEALQDAEGPVVIEVGDDMTVTMVLQDTLHLYCIEEAFALLKMENVLFPYYLPEGFWFKRATFPVNPIQHPCAPGVDEYVLLEFYNGTDIITLSVNYWYPLRGTRQISPFQEEIMIGDYMAMIAEGILAIVIGNAEYVFLGGDVGGTVIIDGIEHGIIDSLITQDEMVRMAESLR